MKKYKKIAVLLMTGVMAAAICACAGPENKKADSGAASEKSENSGSVSGDVKMVQLSVSD